MGSSLLVALFMAPLLVLVGQGNWSTHGSRLFQSFEAVAAAIAVTVANLISLDGRLIGWKEHYSWQPTVQGLLYSSSLIDNPKLYGDFYKTSQEHRESNLEVQNIHK